jgi:predicted permease
MAAAALGPRINVSCQAVVQILLVIGIGAWLSARRGLDRQALAAVSLVNWHALIPALMVSVCPPAAAECS